MDADNDMYKLTPLPFQGADCSHSALSSCNSFSDDFQSFLEDQFHDDEVASGEPTSSLGFASNNPAGHPDQMLLPGRVREQLHEQIAESCVTGLHNDNGGRVKRSEAYAVCMSAWRNSAQWSRLDLQSCIRHVQVNIQSLSYPADPDRQFGSSN